MFKVKVMSGQKDLRTFKLCEERLCHTPAVKENVVELQCVKENNSK